MTHARLIQPGTVAAIAASLMAQGENLGEQGEIFSPHWNRKRRIQQFVTLAREIAEETMAQDLELTYSRIDKVKP